MRGREENVVRVTGHYGSCASAAGGDGDGDGDEESGRMWEARERKETKGNERKESEGSW